jgi:hypothetical protein
MEISTGMNVRELTEEIYKLYDNLLVTQMKLTHTDSGSGREEILENWKKLLDYGI